MPVCCLDFEPKISLKKNFYLIALDCCAWFNFLTVRRTNKKWTHGYGNNSHLIEFFCCEEKYFLGQKKRDYIRWLDN